MSANNQKMTQEQEWQAWAAAAQKGEKAAYNKLLGSIASFIKGYIIGTLANPDWADDITQEVLISVHKSLNTYSADRPFKPWLISIIHFRKTDFLRKHYNARNDQKTSLDDKDFIQQHVTNPGASGEYKDIERALDTIPDKQRKIFEMMKIQGYSAKEVAEKMDMTESAVKVSAHRTANKLKEELG